MTVPGQGTAPRPSPEIPIPSRPTSSFRKDIKKLKKQGKDFALLRRFIEDLSAGRKLSTMPPVRDHALTGEFEGFVGCRECHLKPDWLFVYLPRLDEIVLVRTGSHSELFG
jgi:mRNA interferase YafQ